MYYFDTSALAKLVLEEEQTPALRAFVRGLEAAEVVTSSLTRAELLRAAYRYRESAVAKAREVLKGIAEIIVTEALLDRAGTLGPPFLRTLDAIHLASALELEPELKGVVAYDSRLTEAAKQLSIHTVSPGSP